MTLLIDTRAAADSDPVESWVSASRELYHPLRVAIEQGSSSAFQAQMWGDWLPGVGIFRVAASGNTMRRTWDDIAAGDPECLHVSILLSGRLRGRQQGRESVLEPGDITTYDTSTPAAFHAPDAFDLLVLKLPRAVLGTAAAQISRLTGLRIGGRVGLPRVAAGFFRGVAAGVSDGSIATDDADIAEHVIDLVCRLYSDLEAAQPPRPRPHTELLERAKSFVELNLGNPELTPELVARACFISTRYLHRLFAEDGLSVCDWIRAERLARCRRDLLDPALANEPVGAIGARWGLRSPAHFSRLFRAAYGSAPRDFRRAARPGAPVVADRADLRSVSNSRTRRASAIARWSHPRLSEDPSGI
jgi:AraC-like DNA-binding protein